MTTKALLLTVVVSAAAGTPDGVAHKSWDRILRDYSQDGWVDYARLKADRGRLDGYLKELAAVPAAKERSWSREKRLAFWINAYNAFALRSIADNYPIRAGWGFAAVRYPKNSIKQIPGVFDKTLHEAAGRRLTLDGIEHKVLRGELQEPRIHAAIVCASVGCPPLRAEAYAADTIEAQLDDNMRRFLAERNRLDSTDGSIGLSMIFKWFAEDFRRFDDGKFDAYPKDVRGVLALAARYLPAEAGSRLRTSPARVRWLPYDWTLNDRPIRD